MLIFDDPPHDEKLIPHFADFWTKRAVLLVFDALPTCFLSFSIERL